MSSPATIFRKYLWRSIAFALPAGALLRGAWLRQVEVAQWPQLPDAPVLDDTNIWTRLEQARQWIAGGGFDEQVLRDANAAVDGVERAWSRLMDILISVFHSFTPDAWADETRLMVAAAWLPAVLGIFGFAFLARASLKRFNNWHVLFTLVFLLAVNPLSGYFTPGDVDRHSIVIVMWCGVLGLMLAPLTMRRAAIAGVMTGVMIWGEAEALAPAALACVLAGYVAFRKPKELRAVAVMIVVAVLTAAVALAAEGRTDLFAAFTAAPALEMKPLFSFGWSIALQHIWQPLLALALLLRLRRGRAEDAVLGALLAACCFLAIAQVRFSYYAQVVAVLAIAPLLPVYATQMARGVMRKLRPYALLLGCCAVVIAVAPPFGAPAEADTRACQAQMRYVIQTQQLQKLAGQGPRRIFAPVDVAGDIIFFTPWRVIAGEYGREGQNMERQRAIAAETKSDTARKLLKESGVDHVFFCPLQAPKGSWLAGKPPAWLAPVDGMMFTAKLKSPPLLYAVKK